MSKFVKSDRHVCYELPDGTISDAPEGAFRELRNALPAEQQSQVNAVYIASKMGLYRRNIVMDEMLRVSQDVQVQAGEGAAATKPTNIQFNIGAQQIALLRHNILKWDGPGFANDKGVALPLTQANIDSLDKDDPLVTHVLNTITRLNRATPAGANDPNAVTPATSIDGTAGSTTAGDSDSMTN